MKNIFYLLMLLFAVVTLGMKVPLKAKVVYQDDLVRNNPSWPLDSNQYNVIKFSGGHYSVRVDSPDHCARPLAPYGLINFPYTVQVDCITVLDDTSKTGNVAVVFNQTDNSNFAVAEIWTNGTYRIWSRVRGRNVHVVGFTYNQAIRKGTGCKNTIRVIQKQSEMELYVNNVAVGNFKIELPSSLLGCGPSVATMITGFTPETGLFNNFIISKN